MPISLLSEGQCGYQKTSEERDRLYKRLRRFTPKDLCRRRNMTLIQPRLSGENRANKKETDLQNSDR